MRVVRLADVLGSRHDVVTPDWRSRRLILADAGMGFSVHDTVLRAGSEIEMRYLHHLEAVYCIEGRGTVEDVVGGITHQIDPGTLYALDRHDHHILRPATEMRCVCVFNPPVTGNEVHQEDGSYPLVAEGTGP